MRTCVIPKVFVVAGMIALGAVGASAAAFIALVTPSSLASTGWMAQVSDGADMQFVAGLSQFGAGSVRMSLDKDKDAGAQLRLSWLDWAMPLDRLGSISYTTYVTGKTCKGNEKHRRAPYVGLDVDSDGDFIADDMLMFDPAVNGTIQCDTWQQWSTYGGATPWFSSSDKKPTSLAVYLAAHPNATIVWGGVRLVAGYGDARWKGFDGYVDAFTISKIVPCDPAIPFCLPGPSGTYDFEPDPIAAP